MKLTTHETHRLRLGATICAATLFAACGSQPGAPIPEDDVTVPVDAGDATDTADIADAVDAPDVAQDGDDDGVDADADAVDVSDDLPRPPPFDGFDDPGWQDSSEPLCPPAATWARRAAIGAGDGRVVLAVIADATGSRFELFGNSGEGWSPLRYLDETENIHEIVHVDETSLWYRGIRSDGFGLRQGGLFVAELSSSAPPDILVPDATAVFMLEDGRGAALTSRAPGVVRNTGDGWEPLEAAPIPFDLSDLHGIWTNGEELLVVGEGGTILGTTGDEWRVADSGTIDPFRYVAGADAIRWAVTVYGDVYRRADGIWAPVPNAPLPDDNVCMDRGTDAVTAVWIGPDSIYFTRGTELLRAGGTGGVERLADWHAFESADGTCSSTLGVLDVEGLSSSDIFLLTSEGPDAAFRCSHYLIHFDGASFRWF